MWLLEAIFKCSESFRNVTMLVESSVGHLKTTPVFGSFSINFAGFAPQNRHLSDIPGKTRLEVVSKKPKNLKEDVILFYGVHTPQRAQVRVCATTSSSTYLQNPSWQTLT